MAKIFLRLIFITLFVTTICYAIEPLQGIGMQVGIIFPEVDIQQPVDFMLRGQHGTLSKDIHLDSYLSYWSNRNTETDSLSKKWSVLQMGTLFKYFIFQDQKLSVYSGGGVSLQWRQLSFENDKKSDSKWSLALQFLCGCEIPLHEKINGVVEIEYSIDGIDFWAVTAGMNYKF
ncbi:hypothetical protein JW935_17625 [candidate division KSB1 bacterium]|nr:hypothetical protein [candidate division KSB1 bacterium]